MQEFIWFHQNISITQIQPLAKGNMGEHLGMAFTEIGPNFLKASMPVDHRTTQPYGLLHGGASVALAETVGSVASALLVDTDQFLVVGLEINANHLRGVREGVVVATCTPIHIGGTTHVWDIKIHDGKEKLICISRLTVAVLKKNG